ncbi:MAG: MotA/TolQ/ExbB proton channel family protein [Proteobacteria bacterium]|nr:MotA/TolQ/ExbB proton channel family protein [Pseudomonadota bacterium]MBU1711405.1 MotA/TolQ/ExbB proton channel family protein [Pseudomonadota bacterium]
MTMFVLYTTAIILVVNWIYYSVFKLTRSRYYDPVQRSKLIHVLKDPSIQGNFEEFQKKSAKLVTGYSNYLSEIIGAIIPNAIKQPFMLEQYFRAKVENINDKYIDGINTINLFSNIAPIVGFFGTLLGLIQAFRESSNTMLAQGQMTPESFAALQASIMIAIITSLAGVSLKIIGSIMRHHLVSKMGMIGEEIASIPIEVLYKDFGRRQHDFEK